MGNEVGNPAHDPNHEAAFPQGPKYQQAGGKDQQHRRLATHEFWRGELSEDMPDAPQERVH